MTGHIAVLANPAAGRGRGRQAAAAATAELRRLGATVREYIGGSASDTASLATRALNEAPASLVIVGGDGTLNGVLDVLLGSATPLTLVPAGTGNDLARSLGIPRKNPAAAAALALLGTPRIIDVGEIHTPERLSHFLTVAALGFDALVSDRTNRLSWPRGPLRYTVAIAVELLRLRPFAFSIAVDEGPEELRPGTLLAVGNTEYYGAGMPVCPGALADDGLLDTVHVAPLGRLRLVTLFPSLLKGTHLTYPEASQQRMSSIRVSAPGLVVFADGERLGSDACTISVRKGALSIMVPRTSDARKETENDEI